MSVPDEELSGGGDARIGDHTPMDVDPPVDAVQPEVNRAATATTTRFVVNGTAATTQPAADEASDGMALPSEAPLTEEIDHPQQPPQPRLCGVCHEKPGKYKCTRCGLPFCSVPCNKFHRENHPPDPEPLSPAAELAPAPMPAVEEPPNPFRTLGESDQLRYLFRRYPDLADQLLAIVAETDPPLGEAPPTTFSQIMAARAAAAASGGKHQKKEQWNHDVGIRKGKESLRAARRVEGEAGDGVREYTELVLHFAAQGEAAAALAGGRNIVADGSSARQDAELIKRLLDEDTR